jgi:hypothetical protein
MRVSRARGEDYTGVCVDTRPGRNECVNPHLHLHVHWSGSASALALEDNATRGG